MNEHRKTILFCDNTLWGLVNFRGDIIRHFVEKGYRVVLSAPEKEDKQMRTTLPEGVEYEPIAMGRASTSPINDLRYAWRLHKVFRRVNPDYIFTYTIKPNVYGSLLSRLHHKKLTAMMAGMGYVFTNNNLAARFGRWLYRLGLRHADHLLLLNSENLETVCRLNLCPRSKIILLEGGEGVDLNKFTATDNQASHTTFLFIGRILWDKGYEQFSQAARLVKQHFPEAEFHLLGSLDPSYPMSVPRERIMKDQEEGIVTYRGFTSDMQSVMRQPGIVVTLPSFYGEGMNRSLMEACAAGKPIITTDIAGCRELVDNNKNGFVVPPKDTEALAKAMTDYLMLDDQQKAQLSTASRELAERRFDIRRVIEVYEKLVETCC